MTTNSSGKPLSWYPAHMQQAVTIQNKYLGGIERAQGLATARIAAVDQIGANVAWLLADGSYRVERRELYDFLTMLADSAVQPTLIPSE